jgi:large repetitive protein
MRLLRFAAFSLSLVFTCLSFAYCQATSSIAGVGDDGSNQNLCFQNPVGKNGRTSAKCSAAVANSGTATADAVAQYPGLGIAGSADVALNEYSTTHSMGSNAATTEEDYLTVGGSYPSGASLFAAASVTATPGGQAQFVQISFSLTLQDYYVGQCFITTFGQSSCSTTVLLQEGPVVDLKMSLAGGASATCDIVGCASGSTLSGSAKLLVLKVVDSTGNPVKGSTITSASGHKYPTLFASTTALTASPNPSAQGNPVTFTAAIASFGRSGTPTGKVTFKDSTTGTTLGHVTLNAGVASLTTSSLATGTHTITASYSGDNWSAASHGTVSQVVN